MVAARTLIARPGVSVRWRQPEWRNDHGKIIGAARIGLTHFVGLTATDEAWYRESMTHAIDPMLGMFVDHLTQGFTPELARHFAELPKPAPEFQAHLDSLAEKANEGNLTPEEARQYDKYVEYMDFVALVRLKARSRISNTPES